MPNYVKIGRTENLEQRMRSLDTTGVPLPFQCFYACTVNDATRVEQSLHDAFGDFRVRRNREFFAISPDRIRAAARLAEIEDITPNDDIGDSEDLAAIEREQRRSPFSFRMVNIKPGEIITFLDKPDIQATVVNNRRIQMADGTETSLTATARMILNHKGAPNGPRYWTYKGETLSERRHRLESEDD